MRRVNLRDAWNESDYKCFGCNDYVNVRVGDVFCFKGENRLMKYLGSDDSLSSSAGGVCVANASAGYFSNFIEPEISFIRELLLSDEDLCITTDSFTVWELIDDILSPLMKEIESYKGTIYIESNSYDEICGVKVHLFPFLSLAYDKLKDSNFTSGTIIYCIVEGSFYELIGDRFLKDKIRPEIRGIALELYHIFGDKFIDKIKIYSEISDVNIIDNIYKSFEDKGIDNDMILFCS